MDGDRFDALARTVFLAAGRSRRALLRLLAGGAGAAGLGHLLGGTAAAVCKAAGKPCGAGDECCSKLCAGGRCVCRQVGDRCAGGANCCSRICKQGFCRCVLTDDGDCPPDRYCCDNGFCEKCCTHSHCPANAKCCRRSFCKADVECGQDKDCGIGNRCKDCEVCVCDPQKCAESDLNGCCPPDDPIGFCQPGFGPKYCGKGGKTCEICNTAKGQKCHPEQRRCVCDAAKCKQRNGCCHPGSKTCHPGTALSACGKGGKTCEDCAKRGAGWICQAKRCCVKEGAACPCAADGACGKCCGGQCKDGKCAAACGVDCPAPRQCCGSSNNICCDTGRLCCVEQCVFEYPNHCGGCGKPCLPNGAADRCVGGQCRCGDGPPCDCSQGHVCHTDLGSGEGRCVCGTTKIDDPGDPGQRVCGVSQPGTCSFQLEGGTGFNCTNGSPPLCECTFANATHDGRCPV